jgi:predicted HicB family RNase H-like nuclease
MEKKFTKQVRVAHDIHKMFKLYATQKGMSMTDVLNKVLADKVKKN